MLCHNNFEIVRKLIDQVLLDIKENTYQEDKVKNILKLTISTKPIQILPVIHKIIDEKKTEKGINILKENLVKITEELKLDIENFDDTLAYLDNSNQQNISFANLDVSEDQQLNNLTGKELGRIIQR